MIGQGQGVRAVSEEGRATRAGPVTGRFAHGRTYTPFVGSNGWRVSLRTAKPAAAPAGAGVRADPAGTRRGSAHRGRLASAVTLSRFPAGPARLPGTSAAWHSVCPGDRSVIPTSVRCPAGPREKRGTAVRPRPRDAGSRTVRSARLPVAAECGSQPARRPRAEVGRVERAGAGGHDTQQRGARGDREVLDVAP